jgi:hypothetical protein
MPELWSAPLIVVSTFTVDRIRDGDGNLLSSFPGGPARYVGEALQRLGRPFRLITGAVAQVDVVLTESGEEYTIGPLPPIRVPADLEGTIILSPIAREIEVDALPAGEDTLVMDLQGFVREPGRSTAQPSAPRDLSSLCRRVSLVKASPRELALLTPASRDALQDALLAVTRGAEGVSLRGPDFETFIPGRTVPTTSTIGAGDTFLAAFVHELMAGEPPVPAATSAVRFTERFLRNRVHEDPEA